MTKLPVFETERLIIREVTEADIPAYTLHFVDYEVIRHLVLAPWPYPENGVREYLQTHVFPRQGMGYWMWGLHLRDKPHELIGAIDLWHQGRPENRVFWLGRKFWGQGLMTEAVAPVMDYAFACLGFERLVFSNARGNAGSRRIKEKTGARLIGVETAKFVDPAYTERELWELTREEWLALRVNR